MRLLFVLAALSATLAAAGCGSSGGGSASGGGTTTVRKTVSVRTAAAPAPSGCDRIKQQLKQIADVTGTRIGAALTASSKQDALAQLDRARANLTQAAQQLRAVETDAKLQPATRRLAAALDAFAADVKTARTRMRQGDTAGAARAIEDAKTLNRVQSATKAVKRECA